MLMLDLPAESCWISDTGCKIETYIFFNWGGVQSTCINRFRLTWALLYIIVVLQSCIWNKFMQLFLLSSFDGFQLLYRLSNAYPTPTDTTDTIKTYIFFNWGGVQSICINRFRLTWALLYIIVVLQSCIWNKFMQLFLLSSFDGFQLLYRLSNTYCIAYPTPTDTTDTTDTLIFGGKTTRRPAYT
jgi:hypothetical protein